jgi:hypothetical protein
MRAFAILAVAASVLTSSGCGYDRMQSQDEQINAAWAEVLNQYQRRADLIPNLVETVRAFAEQERAVLIGVAEARARASSIQATPELLDDPEAFSRFQAAQGELSGALSRLLVTVERSPSCSRTRTSVTSSPTRGHREPRRGGAQPLHRGGSSVQHDDSLLPVQPHRDAVRLRSQADVRSRERG